MRNHLLLLLALHLSDVSLLWLLFAVGLFIKWMSRMLSLMETFKKKCTCNHPLAIHTQSIKFVAFAMLFMALSRLLELDLKSLAQLLLSRISLRVLMILLSLSEDPLLVSLLFFFMLMIWLLLEMILQVSALFNTSLVSILRWKIWTLSYFLRLEVTSSFDRYYLSQAKYASDLFSKANITDNRTVSTPLEYNAKLTPLDGEPIFDATRYH